ncbi:MAG: FG-GAP-like repeat-containing protein, partial [Chitinophagales bacterium]
DVYTADIDGDGDMDVLAVFFWGNKIIWYENDGNGQFDTENIIFAQGNWGESVYATDLDDDGDIDVLSASSYDDRIARYENDGNGNFNRKSISVEADGASSVYAADLDGDGDMDVLSASKEDDKIAWYRNNGGNSFTGEIIISTNAEGARCVYATDLDGDGDIDVLSASREDDKIAWYENQGMGEFGNEKIISNKAKGANSVYAADLDGDGDMDVLSASENDSRVTWYENKGGGGFGSSKGILYSVGANSVYAADIDSDGDMDVLSTSSYEKIIALKKNDGNGKFSELDIVTTDVNVGKSIYAADLDGDGDLDLLSASSLDNKIAWYENLTTLNMETLINNLPCMGISNGSFQVNLSGVGLYPPYEYTWSLNDGEKLGGGNSNSENFIIENLSTGNYDITLSNANSFTITSEDHYLGTIIGDFFEVVDIVTTNSSNGLENGSIQISVSGGNPDYTFNWSGSGSGSQTTNNANYIIDNLSSGDYNVLVKDKDGNNSQYTITLLDETVSSNTCNNPLDVVILNDVSGSVDAIEYAESKQFFIDFASALNIGTGESESRAAIIEWADTDERKTRIPLTGILSDIKNYTSYNRLYDGGTNPLSALKYGRSYLAANARSDATKILVLSTDAKPDQVSGSLIALSKEYQAEGYIIVTIAFDEAYSDGFVRNILTETASIPLLAPGAPAYSHLDNTLANYIANVYVCPSDPGSSNTVYFNRDGVLDIMDYTPIDFCPSPENIEVTFRITAQQQLALPSGTPVTFYYNNPELFSATQILTTFIPCSIEPGASEIFTVILPVKSAANIWGVLNDDGNQSPPISFPITDISENVYLNNIDNISVCLEPVPTLTALKYTTTPKPICDNTVIYTVDVCNISSVDAVEVSIIDQAPNDFILEGSNQNLNICATENNDGSFDIPVGCCVSITYQYNVSDAASGQYNSQGVRISGPEQQTYQNFTGLGTSSEDVEIGEGIDCDSDVVLFSKIVNKTLVCEESFVTFTFQIDNQTNVALQGISFRDVLPNPVIWAAEPYLLSGLSIGSTEITGSSTANFIIAEIAPQTITTFSMDAYLGDWSASGNLSNTAILSGFPNFVNGDGASLSSSSENVAVNVLSNIQTNNIVEIIEGDTAILSVIVNGNSDLQWTTNGEGILANPNEITTTYIPSESDIEVGFVDFNISVESSLEGCDEASALLQLVIRDKVCLGLERLERNSLIVPGIEALDTLVLCAGESILLELSTMDIETSHYLWQDGSNETTFLVSESGRYSIEVTDSSTCQLLTDEIFIKVNNPSSFNAFILPNAFSPNDDGINDVFQASRTLPLEVLQFDFWVYNRWGELVFKSGSIERTWMGENAPLGVYVWHYQAEVGTELEGCEGRQVLKVSDKGNVTLIR